MSTPNAEPANGSHAVWVEVDDGRLRVVVGGDGPPLLLLHGWPLDHTAFDAQAPLARDLMTIRPDRRGFGRSTAPPDLTRELDDIDRVLDKLGIDTVHLLGMSQGARIALRYAAIRGERLRSLIVQGAVVDGVDAAPDDDEAIPIVAYAALARAGDIQALRDAWLAHPMMSLDGVAAGDAERIRAAVGRYDARDLCGDVPRRYAFSGGVLDGLARFPRPALIITGSHETASRRAHADVLQRALPDSTTLTLRNSGHLCNLSEAGAYNDAVREFVLAAERRR